MPRAPRLCALILLMLLASCGDSTPAPGGNDAEPPSPEAGTVEIGTISYKPLETVAEFRPLTDYLETQGLACEPVAATSVEDAVRMLREGELDVVIDSPVIVYHLSRQVPLEVPLRRSKGGVGSYHSVIFARRDSRLENVEDLRGRMVVFEDPWSTSGYFLPAGIITGRGLTLSPKEGPDEPVGIDEVGGVFALDEENIVLWVLTGRVAAGAVSNLDFEEYAGEQARELSVIVRSDPVPRHVVAVRADLPEETVATLLTTLTGMTDSPEGRAALAAFEETGEFRPLEDEATLREDLLEVLRALLP